MFFSLFHFWFSRRSRPLVKKMTQERIQELEKELARLKADCEENEKKV
jgi:hypothetical protein